MAAIEHRHGARRRAIALAEVHCCNGQRVDGLLFNLSAGGMFVVSEAAPQVNGGVEVWVVTHNDSIEKICLPGLVVHRSGDGFGVMFRDLDGSARAFVDRHLS